jgi:hypothetical protein
MIILENMRMKSPVYYGGVSGFATNERYRFDREITKDRTLMENMTMKSLFDTFCEGCG